MDALPFLFMNAAGWVKTPELVEKVARVPLTTHIEAGSFTVTFRPPREGGTAFDVLDDGTASNNLSLPNGGLGYLAEHGPEMVAIAHKAGKKLFVNGAPFSPNDDAQLALTTLHIGADGYVSNRGCPNTDNDIISYNHAMMAECDNAVDQAIGMQLPWWRKVSPYANPRDREIEAELTLKSTAQGVIACNTFARARLRRNGKPIINASGTNGFGGMSGTGIRYVNLINAEHFVELLMPHGKHVLGCGGISTGDSLQDYLLVGCCGGQVAAALFENEDPGVLQEIAELWAMNYAQAA